MPRRASNEAGCGGVLSDFVKSSEMAISERSCAELAEDAVPAAAAATPATSVDFFRKDRLDSGLDGGSFKRDMMKPQFRLGVVFWRSVCPGGLGSTISSIKSLPETFKPLREVWDRAIVLSGVISCCGDSGGS